ncbi:MAG: hypothetical protein RLZZ352_1399 [Pseudomonadota bacterium]|jgi:hypothetical protein
MKHLENFLDGVASAFMWGMPPRTYRLPESGFREDREKLRGDVQKVGKDLKKSVERHGKQNRESRG